VDLVAAFLTILFVMDPLGNVPIFLSELKDVAEERRQKVIMRELLFALLILVLFLFGGAWFLDLLKLKQESISIAGGIILFLIALKMIFPQPKFGAVDESLSQGEPFLVPLATPCVAGPSTLAVTMLFVHKDPDRMLEIGLALFGAWSVSAIVLLSSPLLLRVLRKRGLMATERLMGMLLVIIAVQMFFDGINRFFAAPV
jgi:multiple antibiotic resistance protein